MSDNYIRPEDIKIDIEEVKHNIEHEINFYYKDENACCEFEIEETKLILKALEQQQARIDALEGLIVKVHGDLEKRAVDNYVDLSDGIWIELCDSLPKPQEKKS